ncbi:hypothetical protein SBA3_2610023 [Candidatus Sulfopaludibacter sp. SbA3]|nr:hypothetical protein SBA3_2610023 [Candidatus Sulfopaludibacter sp. SbA3]
MEPAAKAKEDRQTLIDGRHFFRRKFAKDAPDPSLVDGSQMVDQSEGPLARPLRPGASGG